MKILCIGTLDKFSRFFLNIEEALKKTNNTNVLYIYSIHFSGFLYTLLRFKFSVWLSAKAWVHVLRNKKKYLNILKTQDSYKNIYYKELIKFHVKLSSSISEQNLLLQSLAYIDILEQAFIKLRPDIILLIGDSRLSIETCLVLAKQNKIKTYFIEQGPFNTTIFNDKGVNANASINVDYGTKISYKNEREIIKYINCPSSKKYKRSFIYRSFDYFLNTIFGNCYIFPPDLKHTDTFPTFFKRQLNLFSTVINKGETKTYLLILQVPKDVNMIYHSPHFNDHYSIVKTVYENLPLNTQLILREHPIYRGKYQKELYKYIKTHKLSVDTNISLKDSLKCADVIIVNNSTVGMEAIALKKTVVVLGNSYYNNPHICIIYNQDDNLKNLLKTSLNFKPVKQYLDAFLYEFFFNYSIKGYITDYNLTAAKIISKKIITEFKQQYI